MNLKLALSMIFSFFKRTKTILVVWVALLCYIAYLSFNIGLKDKKIETLRLENGLILNEKALCQNFLDKQNKEIKKLKLSNIKKPDELKEISKIKKIYIKDKSCESELKAYKELFKQGFGQ